MKLSTSALAMLIGMLLLVPWGLAVAQETTNSFCQPGQTPLLDQRFYALAAGLGSQVGEPSECVHTDATSGDVQQQTTQGLFYVRKSTNIATFTNGAAHWVIQSGRLLTWTSPDLDPPADATIDSRGVLPSSEEAAGEGAQGNGALDQSVLRNIPINVLLGDQRKWGFYAYILTSLCIFLYKLVRADFRFLWQVLWVFVVTTIALAVLQYASPWSMTWDFDRWQAGDQFNILPITITDGPASPSVIPKSTNTYWFFTVLTTALYLTFPEAVLNAVSRQVRSLLLLLAQGFGATVGFATVAITIVSLVGPYRSADWLLMLASCGVLLWTLRTSLWADLISDRGVGMLPGLKENWNWISKLLGFFKPKSD